MAEKGKRRVYATRQGLPAFISIIFGLFMMFMPFIVEHGGYNNDILVASSKLGAPFDKTLVFVGQETVDGSVGLILNKPLSASQHAALSPFIRDSGIPVGYGGPIEVSETLFVLEEKRTPKNRVYFDVSSWDDAVHDRPDLLNRIRDSIRKGEQRYRVFTGYAAWGAFQLETEALLKGKWDSIKASHDIVFQNGANSTWDELYEKENPKYQPSVILNQI